MVERKLEGSKLGVNIKVNKNALHYGRKPANFQDGRDKLYGKYSIEENYLRLINKEGRKYSDIDINIFPKSGRRSINKKV